MAVLAMVMVSKCLVKGTLVLW